MHNQAPQVEPADVLPFDPTAAFAAFIQKAAEFGFTSEIDDETGLPSHYLFCVDKYETQRIIVPVDYHKVKGPHWNLIIDRLSHWPFQHEDKRDCTRTVFYRAAMDVTDLEFFGKLILNIFPLPVSPTPY